MATKYLATLISVPLFLCSWSDSHGQPIEIRGSVTTPDGKAIPSVKIRIYRHGKCVAETRSDSDGSYKVAVPKPCEHPIDTVRYDHTEWHSGIVKELHGRKTQDIHKVLNSPDASLSQGVAIEQLIVYEQIYWLDRLSEEPEGIDRLGKEYRTKLTSIGVKTEEVYNKRMTVLALFRLY